MNPAGVNRRGFLKAVGAGAAAVAMVPRVWAAEAPHAPGGKEYFIAPKAGSGAGTAADPFGLADLPDNSSDQLRSKALEALQPGDTLSFRQGDYRLATLEGKYYWLGYIRTARPGLPDRRITIRAHPAETVRLIHAGGGQPMFGGGQYVTFEGFFVEAGPNAAARIGGTGMEIAYCQIKGQFIDTTDNHDGIRIEKCEGCRIHHCDISGVQGKSSNSAGIKLYTTSNAIIEDNYIHDNYTGIFDKDSGINNTYRRNYITANRLQFDGRIQGKIARFIIHDNVIGGQVSLHCGTDGCEIRNNLLRSDTLAGGWAGGVLNNSIFNNIVISGGKPILAFYDHRVVWGGDKANLQYMDQNLYDGPPAYSFGQYSATPSRFTLAEIREKGFERNSQVLAGAAAIFEDEKNWRLRPALAKAGKDGAAPGPANIAEVLDLGRYGPSGRGRKAGAG